MFTQLLQNNSALLPLTHLPVQHHRISVPTELKQAVLRVGLVAEFMQNIIFYKTYLVTWLWGLGSLQYLKHFNHGPV